MVVDVADRISLKIKAKEVIERTGNKMIEMRTQPRSFLLPRKNGNPWPHLLQVIIQSIQAGTEGLSFLVPSSRLPSFEAPEDIGLAIPPIESALMVS